jgi:hypothetical protein
VPHLRQHLASCCAVAAQAVGHDAPRSELETGQQPLEQPLGGTRIPTVLHQDVEHGTVLVHRSPKVAQLAVDPEEDLVQVSNVPRRRAAPAELTGELNTKPPAPLPDTLVRDGNTALGQDQLHVPQAQAEDMIQPDCVADARRGSDGRGRWRARVSSTQLGQLQPFRPEPINLTMPAHVNHLIGDLLLHDQLDTSNNRL